MKKKVFLISGLLGGGVAGVTLGLLMPNETRERLSRQLAARIGVILERLPDG